MFSGIQQVLLLRIFFMTYKKKKQKNFDQIVKGSRIFILE